MADNATEKVRYVSAIGEAMCMVGKFTVSPGKAPLPVSEKEYKDNRREWDFYAEKGTIRIDEPGSKAYVVSAKRAKAMQKLDEESGADGVMPPRAIEVPLIGVPAVVAAAAAQSRMRAAALSDQEIDPLYCRAMKVDGQQCKNKPLKGRNYCVFHARMVINGSEVKDMDGGILALADVE